jgi:hypothetical protein
MITKNREKIESYEEVLAAALALPLPEQTELASAIATQLAPNLQIQIVMTLLPLVAPSVEAALHAAGNSAFSEGDRTAAIALLRSWVASPSSEDDDQAWEAIMHQIGAYNSPPPLL